MRPAKTHGQIVAKGLKHLNCVEKLRQDGLGQQECEVFQPPHQVRPRRDKVPIRGGALYKPEHGFGRAPVVGDGLCFLKANIRNGISQSSILPLDGNMSGGRKRHLNVLVFEACGVAPEGLHQASHPHSASPA